MSWRDEADSDKQKTPALVRTGFGERDMGRSPYIRRRPNRVVTSLTLPTALGARNNTVQSEAIESP